MSDAHQLIDGWEHVSSGKVRDIYAPVDAIASGAAPDRYLMVTSDRISAYDFVMPTPIPDKGKILNQLAIWWMDQVADLVPNHLLRGGDGALAEVPEQVAGRAVVCRALEMVPVECVVRGHLTGSGLAEYEKTGSVCGIGLPEGLVEASKLADPIFTPAAKAELGEHDENISFGKVVDMVGEDLACTVRDLSIALYERAASIAAERGIILADTKFEFGLDATSGQMVLGDEILTPDSSRFWPADRWQPGRITPSYDKQYLRDWLCSPASGWKPSSGQRPPSLPDEVVQATRRRYLEAFRRLTGAEPAL
ncbi:phosphoribosylaminoimidazolesuccinocarboxamide synthase [Schaalia sp. 19OD2882]|uniref:phosphoribosylaminoimidazolesuccinocarboxamide synthase n=1 Tax=Schaalia sp. 19OD2882 TaxID=2794089 RepID=UPI001C1F1CC3|nr:phosphoribosylaminoimidazolesuccinocarboxamide synthase [Schaalia sp. 19OD2882]QWW19382.1 phosphoribosylaminoimidazolesuccinocarboxamide synthase [Schaalia sp. 19OD2882]